MIWTPLAAAALFLIAVAAMAVGVWFGGNRRLRGSCGGLAKLRDSQGRTLCDACTNPSPECRGEPLEEEATVAER